MGHWHGAGGYPAAAGFGSQAMNIHLPYFTNQQLQIAMSNITKAFADAVSKNEGSERVMLRSPNGTVYAITTDNAGVLTTTAISGKDREI
jgi:hypothetical protein